MYLPTQDKENKILLICVDDFGVKYYSQEDLHHFLQTLQYKYKITTDMAGKNFCGMTFDWNYKDGFVDVLMPNYVERSLARLQYKTTKHPQYSPHEYTPITRTKPGSQQYTTTDNSPFVCQQDTKWVQSLVGTFLYYGRAIDGTILPALNEIGLQQGNPTINTMKNVNDY